jgi:CIC family chloride channel protein
VAPPLRGVIDRRTILLTAVAAGLGVIAAFVSLLLTHLIGFFTNLAFYGRLSTSFVSPDHNQLGLWVIPIPIIGGILVGLMARFGSKAIRGHGIPEAMEQILTNHSRVPARLIVLKPLSAAVAIGTGGPFGAEGPIIATGGALGSLVGQLLPSTATERKTLLAAGAAAGMSATFGSPVSAVLLAIELLLFEYRPRSLVPVAMASAVAAAVRAEAMGTVPIFPMAGVASVTLPAFAAYVVVGALIGLAAVGITRTVYAVEDGFERLPVHWIWWPALGGVAVGVIGYFSPHTLGVGYDNIERIVTGDIAGTALLSLCLLKLMSWTIALSSGTSGGTLAPLFTIGGGFGALTGGAIATVLPSLGVDVRLAGLVGMAAMFAGASRALLASVVFAFETTREPTGLLPVLGGCAAAYLISGLLMRNTIMTEKIARRGISVPHAYVAPEVDGQHHHRIRPGLLTSMRWARRSR